MCPLNFFYKYGHRKFYKGKFIRLLISIGARRNLVFECKIYLMYYDNQRFFCALGPRKIYFERFLFFVVNCTTISQLEYLDQDFHSAPLQTFRARRPQAAKESEGAIAFALSLKEAL